MADVVKVEKKKNLLIIDNSLSICTVKGDLFFTSFIERDKCLRHLNNVINKLKNPEVMRTSDINEGDI